MAELEVKEKSDTYKRPVRASEAVKLTISTVSSRIMVTVEPSKQQCKPGEVITIKSTVKSSDGSKPVDEAEVTLLVVDDAILSLSGYTIPSILDTFVRHFVPQVKLGTAAHSRDSVVIAAKILASYKKNTEEEEMTNEDSDGEDDGEKNVDNSSDDDDDDNGFDGDNGGGRLEEENESQSKRKGGGGLAFGMACASAEEPYSPVRHTWQPLRCNAKLAQFLTPDLWFFVCLFVLNYRGGIPNQVRLDLQVPVPIQWHFLKEEEETD